MVTLAQPGVSSSTPPASSQAGGVRSGLLRVVSPAELDARDREQLAALSEANRPKRLPMADLGAYVRQRWMVFRNHRNQGIDPLNFRLLRAQRMFEGKYDESKLAAIRKFGGSEVYSRIGAVKCRGATSLLRDVYLGAERPWDVSPVPDPPVPPDIAASIMQVVAGEVMSARASGQALLPEQAMMRRNTLMYAAQQAARRNAMTQAQSAADKMDDILREGGFYRALGAFLIDLPIFPYACIKGPIVRMVPDIQWNNGKAKLINRARMFWERVDPFNIYWSPGTQSIESSEIIERKRYTRTDLNDLLGLPGYDQEAVRGALEDYRLGLREWLDSTDTESALNEGREDPNYNQSHMIDALEYHGNIQGQMLLDQGVDRRLVPDLDRDYSVQTWIVGRHVIKTQINPSPRKRHPYYLTSFEKVPGTVHGHGLLDIIEDIQEVSNATLRALVNNMSIASGPQVVVDERRLAPTENADELYPWKRWRVVDDELSSTSRPPVDFFQPNSNSQELLMVYSAMSNLADDISAIPRYATGESLSGGAGRTASGLSMLMGNSQKILQTVASNVDDDVVEPALHELYDMIMLTDKTGLLSGDEQIEVNGVTVALQRETERQKQLQFLQITANPIDMAIVGKLGRARVLRRISSGMGIPDDIVPDDQTIQEEQKAEQQLALANPGKDAGTELAKARIENLRAAALASLAKAGGETPTMLPPLDSLSAGVRPPQPGMGQQAAQAQGDQAPTPGPAQLSDFAPPFNNFGQGPNNGAPSNG